MTGISSASIQAFRQRTFHFGQRQFIIKGLANRRFWNDLYHHAISASWPTFFISAGLLFLLLNLCFGTLYWVDGSAITKLTSHSFSDAFFFSVETLATVGYGEMHPQTLYGHIVSAVEMFSGISSVALLTGLTFARFSRPRARFLFAQHAVVHPVNGVPTLVMRVANERQDVILKATARLFLMRMDTSTEGVKVYRAIALKLVSDIHPELSLGWSVMHVIDEQSPLHDMSSEALTAIDSSLILIIEGVDEATSQPMLARHRWQPEEIRWNQQYRNMVHLGEDGAEIIDFTAFHDSSPL
ncbi:MAG TPA: ion channel [Castellaniella sp.]|uniref:ion channel n=1 Tax=Castellaniella sp. TaxID=1955812 RepID=UPI002F042D91